MAGLVPDIHVFVALDQAGDARVKPGHDEITGLAKTIGAAPANWIHRLRGV
jgi:hypothetical protein